MNLSRSTPSNFDLTVCPLRRFQKCNTVPDAVGWVELRLGPRLHVGQYKISTLQLVVGRGVVGERCDDWPKQHGVGGSMSGREEINCEGESGEPAKTPVFYVVAVRWIQLEQLRRLAHAALEGYLTRSECVPQMVEWQG